MYNWAQNLLLFLSPDFLYQPLRAIPALRALGSLAVLLCQMNIAKLIPVSLRRYFPNNVYQIITWMGFIPIRGVQNFMFYSTVFFIDLFLAFKKIVVFSMSVTSSLVFTAQSLSGAAKNHNLVQIPLFTYFFLFQIMFSLL